MKKFLVPVDFSETSKNAARFAAALARDTSDGTLILYHVYDSFTAGSDGSPLTEEDSDRRTVLGQALDNWKSELSQPSVNIDSSIEEGSDLLKSVDAFVRKSGVDLVIVGITGATKMEQILFGSNSIELAKNASCPVIVVPPEARYRKIRNVLFACDFEDVEASIPSEPLKKALEIFSPKVFVVNVSDSDAKTRREYEPQRVVLERMLNQYQPDFHVIRETGFEEAISRFSDEKKIDLIVTIPKKHSFIAGIFNPSHTSRLAYHSHVPLMAVHE